MDFFTYIYVLLAILYILILNVKFGGKTYKELTVKLKVKCTVKKKIQIHFVTSNISIYVFMFRDICLHIYLYILLNLSKKDILNFKILNINQL